MMSVRVVFGVSGAEPVDDGGPGVPPPQWTGETLRTTGFRVVRIRIARVGQVGRIAQVGHVGRIRIARVTRAGRFRVGRDRFRVRPGRPGGPGAFGGVPGRRARRLGPAGAEHHAGRRDHDQRAPRPMRGGVSSVPPRQGPGGGAALRGTPRAGAVDGGNVLLEGRHSHANPLRTLKIFGRTCTGVSVATHLTYCILTDRSEKTTIRQAVIDRKWSEAPLEVG